MLAPSTTESTVIVLRFVITLTFHANFTPFIDQLNNTFFLTLFLLHQDLHKHHDIPEDHIHRSDIQQTPMTNLRSGSLRVYYRAYPTTRQSIDP